jgi:hypothetical protein
MLWRVASAAGEAVVLLPVGVAVREAESFRRAVVKDGAHQAEFLQLEERVGVVAVG